MCPGETSIIAKNLPKIVSSNNDDYDNKVRKFLERTAGAFPAALRSGPGNVPLFPSSLTGSGKRAAHKHVLT